MFSSPDQIICLVEHSRQCWGGKWQNKVISLISLCVSIRNASVKTSRPIHSTEDDILFHTNYLLYVSTRLWVLP